MPILLTHHSFVFILVDCFFRIFVVGLLELQVSPCVTFLLFSDFF